jgi:hypothetical protein
MTYPNEALTEIANVLLRDYGLSIAQIKLVAGDLVGACEDMAEAAWEDMYDAETIAGRQVSYERNIIDAGRGELLG